MVDLPVVKNPPANTGDARDESSIPGSGRSLEEEMVIHSCMLVWKIPWREDPGGLQSVGFAELDTTEYASHLPWWVGGGGHIREEVPKGPFWPLCCLLSHHRRPRRWLLLAPGPRFSLCLESVSAPS